MSKKYVIEIKPEYEDSFKGVMILGAKDSNLFVDTLAVEELEEFSFKGVMILGAKDSNLFVDTLAVDDLEELNSDYINEHYGSLQDEAYKRGLEDGKQTAVGAAELREKLEYQKGFEKGKDVRIKGCEGCMYQDTTIEHNPCNLCCNAFLNRWAAKDDKIEVGDEVNWLGDCFIVTRIFQPRNMKEQCDGIDDDGCTYHDVLMDDLEKTGRHFDIGKILEDMRCGQ